MEVGNGVWDGNGNGGGGRVELGMVGIGWVMWFGKVV